MLFSMTKSIWFKPISLEEINERAKNSLCSCLRMEFIEVGNDFLIAKMPVNDKTIQPMGILHGGATCALAESVASAAANYCVDPGLKVCVGLEINVNHIRAVRYGCCITAKTTPLHLGKTTQVWDIKIRKEDNDLVAVSRLTLAILDKK